MPAISHIPGGDILCSTQTIASVSGAEATRQAILRRLLTVPVDYIWDPSYGFGAQQYVGQPVYPSEIIARITAQVQGTDGVDSSAPVNVTLTENGVSGYDCAVQYTDAATGTAQYLSFPTTTGT